MIGIDLSGTTALVTGATGGLGAAIAYRFAEAGASVVLHYGRDLGGAQRVARSIESIGQVALAQADLTNPEAVASLFGENASYGPVDTLVNNAGIYPSSALLETSTSDWSRVLDTNATGPFLCIQAAARQMATRGGGQVVNVASLSASRPSPDQSSYSSSKAALVALTRSAAVGLAPLGIRVNAVSPGLVARPGIETAWPDGVTRWQDRSPLRRLGEPVDVANACVFLASSLASWITGHELVIDGGVSWAPAY